jgi:hypothetical protein
MEAKALRDTGSPNKKRAVIVVRIIVHYAKCVGDPKRICGDLPFFGFCK